MSKEKQIKEMAQAMCGNGTSRGECVMDDEPCSLECVYGSCAERLYGKGYRKQEWISVEERLPEPQKLVLCIWERDDGWNYGFARYQREDVWYVSNEGMPRVTHWMPLPAPPKGE
jgi:hypothetical protein